MKKKTRKKSAIAKDLHTPKYKLQVQKDKKRKSLIKYLDEMIDDFLKGFK